MKKPFVHLTIALACSAFTLISCGNSSESLSSSSASDISESSASSLPISSSESSSEDTNNPIISTKYRTYYQILIYSFADSDGDGIGDFKGIADKFDYLKTLGVNGLWLSPAHPATSYHGYDVLDYYMINPHYETTGYTFDNFIADAKANDIAIIMDLVLNHTSNEHTWFTQGLNAFKNNTESKYKTYYTYSLTQTTQCPNSMNGVYYESLFSSGMPDLNYDNPEVRAEAINIGKYWLDKGVSGFRLDGAMHIFTNYASPTFSTDKWNNDVYDKNLAWWNEFYTAMVDENEEVYMVGEVWSTEAKVETYYAGGMDSFFNFDARGKITNAINGAL
ncbi:MAG: alpha-amylase family glycosyl hydrolase, partial [Firmicutes bacterium]|nr:alpha-amylase family glycosyl hydrolase [Bacillota bacterium]